MQFIFYLEIVGIDKAKKGLLNDEEAVQTMSQIMLCHILLLIIDEIQRYHHYQIFYYLFFI